MTRMFRLESRFLFYYVWFQCFQNGVQFFICMDVQVDGFCKIQAEGTHDGLGVDDITSGKQVEMYVVFGNLIYESF